MASVSVVPAGPAVALTPVPTVRRRPFFCFFIFPLCDVFALAAVAAFVLLVQPGLHPDAAVERYLALWPAPLAVVIAFACAGLYPGIIHNAVDELRRLGLTLTVTFLAMAALIFTERGTVYRPGSLLLWWLGALFVIPALRSFFRETLCHKPWWGVPVAVFHTGDASIEMIRELEAHPDVGLRPVVVLASELLVPQQRTLPVVDARLASAVRACGVERALIMLSDTASTPLLQDLERFESVFPRLMIFHHAATLYNLTVDARQLGGRLAVEVRRDLLLPVPRTAKRVLDLIIVFAALPTVALIILVLAILVRLESAGPAFYAHPRVGRQRTLFRTWKIRTMVVNGDEVLQRAFALDATLQQEWVRDRKLRRDPRVTRVGRFLRKTSLDELPQFWNVLRGEMSLVGPRPIVEGEIAAYGPNFSLYCRVTPGLTGLWQVSGRSNVSVSDRVRLDSYYVRNWSPWLDLHILARTARVVLTGQGAY
jgi:Undecaprenyl-phosphate galactose phosphotransferase WbaP